MYPKNKKSSTESWDEVWSSYDRERYEYQLAVEEHRVRWQGIQKTIIDKFGSFRGLNYIEIGAGSGHYAMLFSREGANVTLLDYSKKALKFSQAVFKDQGIPEGDVQFICMNALKIEQSLFNKFDVSGSFGVAEHFIESDREVIVKSHFDVLKNDGITFISIPHKNCIPFSIYQFIMKFKNRRTIECYPFTKKEFKELATVPNCRKYFFLGSSYLETYNPMSFINRKRGIIKPISKINKEQPSRFDKYLGREIIFVGFKDIT